MPEHAPCGEHAVAYLVKGYPRRSELFIASEIYRLEQAGVELRLFVIKPADEQERHDVVDRIRATPEYLPATTSLSGTPLGRWLRDNLPPFAPALRRTLRHRPRGVIRAAAAALAQAVRARRSFWSPPRTLYLKEFLLAVALADRLLDEPEVRHLHAHFAHGATTVAWLASTITGLPFSFTGHAKDIYSKSLNPAGLLRRKLLAARFAVTCTEANLRHLRQIAPEAAVHSVYHGLNADLARLVDEPTGTRTANGALHLLGVGRLVPKKGFDVLIDACAVLDRRGIPLDLTLVGAEDEHGDEIRRRVAASGLGHRVRLRGELGQVELREEYRRADAFCLPCRILDNGDRDGIPNVLVEAMACGAPVVTTPVSGIPELVANGVNGLLVPPDDPARLADALARLYDDPALRARLGQAGQETVRERFDGERLAGRLALLFREAAA